MLKRVYEKNDERELFAVVGERGAVHIWQSYSGTEFYGGFEVHRRDSPGFGSPRDGCWLLGGSCWHDGSSLAYEREWRFTWEMFAATGDVNAVFRAVEIAYEEVFRESEAVAVPAPKEPDHAG